METYCKLDIVEFGGRFRTEMDRRVVKEAMLNCVERACARAKIPWDDCDPESVGDDILIMAPESIPRGAFVGEFPRALVAELRNHNDGRQRGEQMKLRLALYAGERGEDGAVENGKIYVERLLNVPEFKKKLAKSSGLLGMILSDHFYHEVVRKSSEYEPGAYREISFKVKETGGTAWIRVPGHELHAMPFSRLRDMLGRRVGGFSV